MIRPPARRHAWWEESARGAAFARVECPQLREKAMRGEGDAPHVRLTVSICHVGEMPRREANGPALQRTAHSMRCDAAPSCTLGVYRMGVR